MKKMLLIICLAFAACGSLFGDTETIDGYTYTYTIADGGACVFGVEDVRCAVSPLPTGALIIPSRLGGYPVTSIGEFAFPGCSGLTSVVIPSGVTNIGYTAFYDCRDLVSVTIPSSVTSIGESAFELCSSLESVTIPSSVTEIWDYAFWGCDGLTSVIIPSNVRDIGCGAFSGCSGLTSVTIPDGVTSIGWWTFYGCSGLTSVTIPSSVTSIEYEAFDGCSSLTTVFVDKGDVDRVKGLLRESGLDVDGITFVESAPVDPTPVDPVNPVGPAPVGPVVDIPVLYSNDVKVIAENETVPYAMSAAVYDGYLKDAEGNLKGTVQVKVAKGMVDKKTGAFGAKVAGTVNGVKVSATSQLQIGEAWCCIPVAITKKAQLAFNLWMPKTGGEVMVEGLRGAIAGKAGSLKDGAVFKCGAGVSKLANVLSSTGGTLLGAYLPEGVGVTQNGTKWEIAKAGKVAFVKGSTEIDAEKAGENPSGLKLAYKAKDGSFNGSFKASAVVDGKIKSYTVNVTGVLVDGVGYGTATLKKPAYSWPVRVE